MKHITNFSTLMKACTRDNLSAIGIDSTRLGDTEGSFTVYKTKTTEASKKASDGFLWWKKTYTETLVDATYIKIIKFATYINETSPHVTVYDESLCKELISLLEEQEEKRFQRTLEDLKDLKEKRLQQIELENKIFGDSQP